MNAQQKKEFLDEFAILQERYGNHTNVANELHISRGHYRKIRNGRAHPSNALAELIILKAREVEARQRDLTEAPA